MRNLLTRLGTLILIFSGLLHSASPQSYEDYDKFCQLVGTKLDSSNLYRVVEKFGYSKIYVDGDASEYSKRATYFFQKERCYVVFEVGEMGGDSTIITFKVTERRPNEQFTVLKETRFNSTDLGGIRVGMKQEEIGRKLGINVASVKDTLSFGDVRKKPMSSEDKVKRGAKESDDLFWDKSFGFIGIFKNGRLSSFNVSQVVSY